MRQEQDGVPRRSDHTAWDDATLIQAAKLYATGLSLAGTALPDDDDFGWQLG